MTEQTAVESIIAMIQKTAADIDSLERTLPALHLNPQYDDGSNQRELIRQRATLEKLKKQLNETQFKLFIKNKSNINGTRNFLAVDHVNKLFCLSTSAATTISYDRIKNVSKVTTEKELKIEAAKLEAAGYKKVFSDDFTEVKDGGR
ncbi:hypothetical protein P7G87_00280 [Enterococcus asini]|uniref:hypothetical protein n=1 Tax=Enterococcus asini TaxID=57732 RepID=UPI002890D6BA|nr:hypothetical protein [Enterococcus asini]MDT2783123.1 hypothetical protein [Enterococcus asini]